MTVPKLQLQLNVYNPFTTPFPTGDPMTKLIYSSSTTVHTLTILSHFKPSIFHLLLINK